MRPSTSTPHVRLAVFAGPSLPPADRFAARGLDYLPPARRGDVEAASGCFDVILLIDGVFRATLATTPHEMLRATRLTRVFGAASMGALRAVECRPYGAVPLGTIAGWYAHGVVEGDDEVAVLMHPSTHAALSVPSVNVRYVARLAQRRGIITAGVARAWIDAARTGIFYAERSWPAIIALAPREARAALDVLARREGDLKRLDARFALRRVARLLGPARAIA